MKPVRGGASLLLIGAGHLAGPSEVQDSAVPPFDKTSGKVFDIITASGPSVFLFLAIEDPAPQQIWDERVDGEPAVEAHVFLARYGDGAMIEIAVNPEFDVATARALADRFARPFGQLPTSLRAGIGRFSILGGGEGFHAGTGQIVVYTEKADQRVSYAHLEEPLFHEAVHTSRAEARGLARGCQAAQAADGRFLTDHAAQSPDCEDRAETALFAFALLQHPDRMPPVDTEDTRRAVPNRIAYVADLRLPPGVPLITAVESPGTCEAGG